MMTHFHFQPAELFVLRIILASAAANILLLAARGATLDVAAYGAAIGGAALLIAIGCAYRWSGRSDRIGSATICSGLFILFTSSLSLFNYLLLPHWSPTIDVALAEIDSALFGYHWTAFVEFSGRHPILNGAMRIAYLSTLPQIAILVAVLGLTGRVADLNSMLLTVTIAGTATIIVWGCFPSLGPSVLYDLPPEVLSAAAPVVGPDYGREISELFRDGSRNLSPNEIRGLIAFPSFHIILALIATYYSRNVPWMFPAFLAVNLVVFPAVLAHGGHHLVDIPAGMAMFFAALYASRQIPIAMTPIQKFAIINS